MRTRKSPRNQEILWRELAKQGAPTTPLPVLNSPNRCWDCVSYPKGGRARGECVLIGQMVNGRSENRPCFKGRSA